MVTRSNQPLRGYNITAGESGFTSKQRKNKPLWLQKVEVLEEQYGSLSRLAMDDPRLLEIRRLKGQEAEASSARKARKARLLEKEWSRKNQ